MTETIGAAAPRPWTPFRQRVRSTAVLGKLTRYVKRLVYLPWNFQKLFDAFAPFRESVRRESQAVHEDLATLQRLLSQTVVSISNEIRPQLQEQQHQLRLLAEYQQFLLKVVAEELRPFTEFQHVLLKTVAHEIRPVVEGDQVLLQTVTDQHRVAAEQLQGHHHFLHLLNDTQQTFNSWLTVFQRKFDMLALDVRERVTCVPDNGTLMEPRIVNVEAYHNRLAQMGGDVRVNVGCGEKPLPGYINVDFREVPEVDVVADARRLPFAPHSLAELASAHLVEHFRQHHLATVLLPYWKGLLRPGGSLRVVCPDWAAMLRRLQAGEMPYADFKLVTFGAQDYSGDDHFSMYTPESLTDVLRQAGFQQIDVLAQDRPNGLCREMEIVAVA
jgi:predicted SAM-dependent methyltransferase